MGHRQIVAHGLSCGVRALLPVLGLVFSLVPTVALAQDHTIGPGHEAEVLDLFAPHALGDEVAGGFRLWGVAIERTRIVVTVRGEGDVEGRVFLVHPDDAMEATATSESFAIERDRAAPTEAGAALDRLVLAVARNDEGGFWEVAEVTTEAPSPSGEHDVRRANLWGSDEWVPIDGIVVILLLFVLAILVATRHLANEPRWMRGALALIVAVGVLLRLALSPAVFLGAWPWTRLYPNARAVVEGRWLAALAHATGETFFATDVTMWTNFAYAAAMPLVLFGHATYLLRDARAGLLAAAAIALLPQHIRFSHCEDGFVGSLVLTSLAFALIHGWLRDPSRVVRGLCLFALPWVLYPGYLLRPLNILFIVVYLAALAFLHTETAPRARRLAGAAIVLGVGAVAVSTFLRVHTEASTIATSHVARDAVRMLVSPTLLVIDDPTRTPVGLIALAVIGGVLAWRAGERALVVFLVGWLLLFVGAHAVVVTETMQPRYMLHLVVPFLLLAATGAVRLASRWRDDRRVRIGLGLAAASVVLGPLVHAGFITDLGYTEIAEYRFVHAARAIVPEHCTILEPTAGSADDPGELRFERIGTIASRHFERRFDVIAVAADGATYASPGRAEPVLSLDALLADPPDCLYVYEGLPCATDPEACASVMRRLPSEPVSEWTVRVHLYDQSANDPRRVLRDGETLPLRVSRVLTAPRAGASASTPN